jgi:hypothetical protein
VITKVLIAAKIGGGLAEKITGFGNMRELQQEDEGVYYRIRVCVSIE